MVNVMWNFAWMVLKSYLHILLLCDENIVRVCQQYYFNFVYLSWNTAIILWREYRLKISKKNLKHISLKMF